MTRPSARLSAGSGFGRLIDREMPLSFTLDGKVFAGFSGDTVLSAVLAAGIDGVGRERGAPLALDARSAPAVRIAGDTDPLDAIPMDRFPVLDGLDLQTLGTRPRPWTMDGLAVAARRAFGRQHDLGLDGLGGEVARRLWLKAEPSERITADLVVVGGGVAGLSAAARAVRLNKRVVLVERRPSLGGDADFFGRYGEEEPPEALVARLVGIVSASPLVRVMVNSEAAALLGNEARVHVVEIVDGRPRGRLVAIAAPRRILAAGALERLPIFPGNRLPGVTGALDAYRLAVDHAVWPGATAVLATSANAPYRLAMRLSETGVSFRRIFDQRPRPQSRFIDFAKAVGTTQTTGTGIRSATLNRSGGRLAVLPDWPAAAQPAQPVFADRLVVSGGWQPNLTLWLQSGGGCHWDAGQGVLAPSGRVSHVLLAGAAAGYRGTAACAASGETATLQLFGRDAPPLRELPADPAFETPDAAPSVAPLDADGGGPSYLDRGRSLAVHAAQPWMTRVLRRFRIDHRAVLPAQPAVALEIGDVVGGVFSGMIPAADAGAVAEERCLVGSDELPTGAWTPPPPRPDLVDLPAFLAGRFGAAPMLWALEAEDQRALGAGALLYPNADAARPDGAIGVVVGAMAGGKASALLGPARAAGDVVFARDVSSTVPVRLIAHAADWRDPEPARHASPDPVAASDAASQGQLASTTEHDARAAADSRAEEKPSSLAAS